MEEHKLFNENCPICLEVLTTSPGSSKSRGDLLSTPCKHLVHEKCLWGWFSRGVPGNCCPICKEPAVKEECVPVLASIRRQVATPCRRSARVEKAKYLKFSESEMAAEGVPDDAIDFETSLPEVSEVLQFLRREPSYHFGATSESSRSMMDSSPVIVSISGGSAPVEATASPSSSTSSSRMSSMASSVGGPVVASVSGASGTPENSSRPAEVASSPTPSILPPSYFTTGASGSELVMPEGHRTPMASLATLEAIRASEREILHMEMEISRMYAEPIDIMVPVTFSTTSTSPPNCRRPSTSRRPVNRSNTERLHSRRPAPTSHKHRRV